MRVDAVRPLDGAAKLTRPTLLLFATGDAWIPRATRERFRAVLSQNPEHSIEEVPGGHANHFGTPWIARVTRFFVDHT